MGQLSCLIFIFSCVQLVIFRRIKNVCISTCQIGYFTGASASDCPTTCCGGCDILHIQAIWSSLIFKAPCAFPSVSSAGLNTENVSGAQVSFMWMATPLIKNWFCKSKWVWRQPISRIARQFAAGSFYVWKQTFATSGVSNWFEVSSYQKLSVNSPFFFVTIKNKNGVNVWFERKMVNTGPYNFSVLIDANFEKHTLQKAIDWATVDMC